VFGVWGGRPVQRVREKRKKVRFFSSGDGGPSQSPNHQILKRTSIE